MGAERAMRRNQQRRAAHEPIPTAGAIDLGKLKDRTGGNLAKQQQALQQVLAQHGFICSCGERFEDEGILAVGAYTGVLEEPETRMTPMGEMPTGRVLRRDGAALNMQAFHSKACPDYLAALRDGLPRGEGELPATVIVVRHAPATEWIGELGTLASNDDADEADEVTEAE